MLTTTTLHCRYRLLNLSGNLRISVISNVGARAASRSRLQLSVLKQKDYWFFTEM